MAFQFSRTKAWFVGSAVLFVALIAVLAWPSRPRASGGATEPLLIYCAANLRVPLEEIIHRYESETGGRVTTQYAGSQTMLINAEVSRKGDLFLPADESYINRARAKSMIDQTLRLATMRPVLAVLRGNPKGIHSVEDLMRDGVKIAQANPEAAAIGQVTRPVLQRAGLWEKLLERTVTTPTTVTDAANAVTTGSVHAAIVWDTTVKQIDGLEAIDLPVFADTQSRVVVAVLKSSKQPAAAMRFAEYLANGDRGLKVLERFGYGVKSATQQTTRP